jgi:hypothetical protein
MDVAAELKRRSLGLVLLVGGAAVGFLNCRRISRG